MCRREKKELLCSYLKKKPCATRNQRKYVCVCGFLWLIQTTLIKKLGATNKKKGKKGFPPNKSNTTLFAMMDYIPGLTAMPIMDI